MIGFIKDCFCVKSTKGTVALVNLIRKAQLSINFSIFEESFFGNLNFDKILDSKVHADIFPLYRRASLRIAESSAP